MSAHNPLRLIKSFHYLLIEGTLQAVLPVHLRLFLARSANDDSILGCQC